MPTSVDVKASWFNSPDASITYSAGDQRMVDSMAFAPRSNKRGSVRSGVKFTDAGDALPSVSGYKTTIAPAQCIVEGANAFQGSYTLWWASAVSVDHDTSHPTLDRIDIVVARAKDSDVDSTGVKNGVIEIVRGTEASTPAAPSVPDNALLLAEVRVPKNGGTLVLTDRRRWTTALGGTLYCTNLSDLTNVPRGSMAYESSTNNISIMTTSGTWSTVFYGAQSWLNLNLYTNIKAYDGNSTPQLLARGDERILRGAVSRIDGNPFYGGGDSANVYTVATLSSSNNRPARPVRAAVASYSTQGFTTIRAFVQTNGEIQINAGSNVNVYWVSLDGIRYFV